jgi:hypothetical protein
MKKNKLNEEYHRECCHRAVSLARALLTDQDAYLQNVVDLLSLHMEMSDGEYDDDFAILYQIHDATDHMPLGTTRQNFSNLWIKKCDTELRDVQNACRKELEISCNSILQRFGSGV